MQDNNNRVILLGNIYSEKYGTGFAGNIWSTDGLCPTLMTMQGGNKQPLIIVESNGDDMDEIQIPCVYDDRDKGYGTKVLNHCPTQRANRGGLKVILNGNTETGYRIRKLTPKECWRLMGFDDADIEKAIDAGVSNTQLYKQAGNSITTCTLYYIFRNLYQAMPYLFDNLKLSSFFSGIGAFEKSLDMLYEDINTGTI